MLSIYFWKVVYTMLRLSFIVGVKSPESIVNYTGKMVYFCTFCALDIALLLASSIPLVMISLTFGQLIAA